ncbi:anhydro-N-acetylmuramic acid kinase [uncultured Sphaerochaeta sp.]|uniref:anhydro-N-acetylmuramic acid kinase n=1 Tax=uncultured Sphaerochaeta sp. TaxID=886478 RepID=UPI002A0A15D7|nr:anhydro-N-acetylmuramic acid kinase [uncultured Sphaerochaeta sp.]
MQSTYTEKDFILAYRAKQSDHRVIGLMSGTSLDGVDAVLVNIKTDIHAEIENIQLVEHYYLPYTDAIREKVAKLCRLDSARIDDLVYVHFGLSEWYAQAVLSLIKKAGCSAEEIDAICMHGQTVWHAPIPQDFPGPSGPIPVKGTLQLGSSAVVRERTGIPVVSDLRSADMAAGGEGAPLAPFTDFQLFGSPNEGRIIQNIGGIGNATVLPMRVGKAGVFAFDTGPGNMVMDAVVEIGTKGIHRYDPEGSIAEKGTVAEELVTLLMQDAYFQRTPPKSTGREVYGKNFTKDFLTLASSRGLSFEDSVATATAFTAESITRSYKDFVLPHFSIAKVLVCGGGALNPTLLHMIQQRLPEGIEVTTTNSYGVPDQAREAMAFAVMGHESLMGRPGNLPAVTGAKRPVVLGVVTL